jgi:hypothetical protein
MTVKPLSEEDFIFNEKTRSAVGDFLSEERLKELFAELKARIVTHTYVNVDKTTTTKHNVFVRLSDIEELFGPLLK